MKIKRNENWDEWKVKRMKIGMKRKKRWMKIEGSSFSMFGLIEKWEEWKYYMLKLHLYPYIPIYNLKAQFNFF